MIAFSTLSFINASAGSFGDRTKQLLEQTQKGGGPGFELYNKAPEAITLTIFINGTFLKWVNISSNQKHNESINLNDSISIGIYDAVTKIETGFLTREITQKPDHFYDLNAPGKTKYVTWNPAKAPYLYPQTGIWMGLLGTSDSRYSLKNNLSQGQIAGQ
jgi:hypothetical protein